MSSTAQDADQHTAVQADARSLLREDPPGPSGWWWLAFVVLAVPATLLRQVGTPATDTLWAEDLSEFMAGAWNTSGLAAVVDPVQGYLHVLARTVAEMVALAPPRWAAALVATASAALAAGCGALAARASRAHVPSPGARMTVAALFVLLPVAVLETSANLANLHWYLIPAAFWVLLWRPRTRSGRIVSMVTVVVAPLSSPILWVMIPVAVARAWLLRGWDRALGLVFVMTATVQLLLVIGLHRGVRSVSLDGILEVLAGRLAASLLLGHRLNVMAWDQWGATVGWVAGAAVLGMLLGMLLTVAPSERVLVGTLAVSSVAVLVAAAAVRGTALMMAWSVTGPSRSGVRYLVAPALLLAWAVAVWVGRQGARSPAVLVVGLLLVGVLVAVDFRLPNERGNGPRWSEQVDRAEHACAGRPSGSVAVRQPPGWATEVACDAFR